MHEFKNINNETELNRLEIKRNVPKQKSIENEH
jgi:hypothetical protein